MSVPERSDGAPRVVPGLDLAGRALRDAGYTTAGLRAILGVTGTDIPYSATDLVRYEHLLAASAGPAATLVAVFCLGETRPADELVAAIGAAAVGALVDGAAVAEQDRGMRAAVRILPHGELLVASDRRPGGAPAAGPLHVTGVNGPAALLASLTVRRPGARVLDLGTGNGIQSLLAASHAASVVATDINPRALQFGAFNAALNAVGPIEFRPGSWYEPVAGERFDLVVGNPPYVISPERSLVFRDSGDEPGALCGRLVRDAPEYLTPGGFATFLVSWPLPGDVGDSWWHTPAGWLGPDGLGWVLMMGSDDPLTHAAQWNLPLAAGRRDAGMDDYRAAVDSWLGYLADRGIGAVGYGAVIQQQRDGAGRMLRASRPTAGAGDATGHIERVFAAADALGADPGAAVAGRRCAIPAAARIDGTLVPAASGWTQGDAQLYLAEGLGIRADLDPVMTEIVLAATSGATVDGAAAAVAQRMGLPGVEADRLRASARHMIGELVGLGLLELAAPGT